MKLVYILYLYIIESIEFIQFNIPRSLKYKPFSHEPRSLVNLRAIELHIQQFCDAAL